MLLGLLIISKNSTSYLKFFVRYCGLKNPAFWFVSRFFNHNSRTRFLQTFCFSKRYKKNFNTSCWSKKAYLNWQGFCQNPKNLFLGTFKSSKPSPSELIYKLGSVTSWEKLEKTNDPEILHCRQMWKGTKPNW